MPYLGNSPAANFASVTKDTFSGNGSTTSFTLSKAATTNGVAVYVENVRQIPTTAYSVSGTTLTFTGTPPSGTNNIYVMHHNTPVSTATHPSAQDLTAANATLTGDVTVGSGTAADRKIVFDGNAQDYHIGLDDSADSLIIGKGSALGTTSHIVTDANGHVTKPLQVYVQAKGNSTRHNQTSANTEQQLDFTEVVDNTNSFAISGGIFTAPVAGRYFIHYYTSQKSNTSYINLILKHNSTTIVRDYNELPNISADWVSQQVTAILDLSASDTVQPFMVSGGTNAYSLENEYRGCSIYLLG